MNKFLTYCTFVAALAAYACGDDDTMSYKPTNNTGADSTVVTPDTSTPKTDSATATDSGTAADSATAVDGATDVDAVAPVDANG